MARHCHMNIIVIECVRGSTIDECRRQSRQSSALPDYARLRRPPSVSHLVEHNSDQRVPSPGNPHAEIVEDALPGELTYRPGQTVVAELARFPSENPGEIGL